MVLELSWLGNGTISIDVTEKLELTVPGFLPHSGLTKEQKVAIKLKTGPHACDNSEWKDLEIDSNYNH